SIAHDAQWVVKWPSYRPGIGIPGSKAGLGDSSCQRCSSSSGNSYRKTRTGVTMAGPSSRFCSRRKCNSPLFAPQTMRPSTAIDDRVSFFHQSIMREEPMWYAHRHFPSDKSHTRRVSSWLPEIAVLPSEDIRTTETGAL